MISQLQQILMHATQLPSTYIEDLQNAPAFPAFVRALPRADYSADGGEAIRGYILEGNGLQLVFNENDEEMVFKPHKHAQSFGVVLQGWCELVIDGVSTTYRQGEMYHVPGGVEHYARQSAGYKDIVIFNEPCRVPRKPVFAEGSSSSLPSAVPIEPDWVI